MSIKMVHAAMVDSFADKFADTVSEIRAYAAVDGSVITPSIIIAMESADEGEDCGDGRVAINAKFCAYCYLGINTQNIQLELREFVTQVFAHVKNNVWNLDNVLVPQHIEAGPGDFNPADNGFESWYVSWEQTIYLGDSVWDASGIVPSEIYVGLSPDIGNGHIDDYEQIV